MRIYRTISGIGKGDNESSANAFLYQLDLPFKPNPIAMLEDSGGMVISGVGDHLEAAKKLFQEGFIKKLENKITGSQLLGTSAGSHEDKLRMVRSSSVPWTGMAMQEMQEFAEFVIEHTAPSRDV